MAERSRQPCKLEVLGGGAEEGKYSYTLSHLLHLHTGRMSIGRTCTLTACCALNCTRAPRASCSQALSEHLADPFGTTVFSKAAVVPGQAVALPCKIPATQAFEGIEIPTPCFLQGLWP